MYIYVNNTVYSSISKNLFIFIFRKFVDFVAKAMTFANIVGEDTNLDATNQDEFDLTAATVKKKNDFN